MQHKQKGYFFYNPLRKKNRRNSFFSVTWSKLSYKLNTSTKQFFFLIFGLLFYKSSNNHEEITTVSAVEQKESIIKQTYSAIFFETCGTLRQISYYNSVEYSTEIKTEPVKPYKKGSLSLWDLIVSEALKALIKYIGKKSCSTISKFLLRLKRKRIYNKIIIYRFRRRKKFKKMEAEKFTLIE